MIEWRRVALCYPCETCGSPPGVPCITIGGNKSITPHQYRTHLASMNHWRDPNEGLADVRHSRVETPRLEER